MIVYRNATEKDMPAVAEVHVATQPEYFTSTLGTDLLTKFYTEFLTEDNLFVVACDTEKNGTVIGFCMGNYYGTRAEKRWERKYKGTIIKRLILKCLQLNRLAISRSFRRVKALLNRFYAGNEKGNVAVYDWHLLSLGVLSEYRGRHIGSTLIDEFEKRCLLNPPAVLSAGGTCTIGAYKWNQAGCSLYASKGYRVFEETEDKLKYTKDLL